MSAPIDLGFGRTSSDEPTLVQIASTLRWQAEEIRQQQRNRELDRKRGFEPGIDDGRLMAAWELDRAALLLGCLRPGEAEKLSARAGRQAEVLPADEKAAA